MTQPRPVQPLSSRHGAPLRPLIDKVAIFTELTRRNALRREAKLPLLDLRLEFTHAVEVATWREAREQHAREITRTCDQVEADFRQRHCPDGGLSVGGRWAINHEIMRPVIELWPDMRFVCQLHTTR
jgi:hypothetical protein